MQLTGGYFQGHEATGDSTFLFEVEYGITDELQIGFNAASQSLVDDPFQDLQQCSVELYYNYFSDLRTGRAYGLGFEFGLPVDSTEDEPRSCVYEPFFVAYQDYGAFATNLSAALEVADPVSHREITSVTGDVAWAAFRRVDRWAAMLEAEVEFGAGETPVRLAPELYWQPFDAPLDFAVSLPIGLSSDAPDWGVFLLAIYEFPTSDRSRR